MALKRRQIFGILLAFLVMFSFFSPQAVSYFNLQEKQHFAVGDELQFFLKLPPEFLNKINVKITEGEKLLALEGDLLKQRCYSLGVNSPVLVQPGHVELQLELFGLIPIKKINVDVVPEINLIPGGQSIGVLLRTEGVMVVGFSPVLNEKNEPCFPARDAGIDVGDAIIEIDGIKTSTDDQVKKIIATANKEKTELAVTLKRKNKILKKVVYAQYCQDSKSYRIGLFVRDNAGGVGTLTFYDPNSKKYGALGHLITDSETNQRINIRQGKILLASVEDIRKANRGNPGEKVGAFIENSDLGNIEKNDDCGIYGVANQNLDNPLYPQAIPIAFSSQIHTGKAKILTVVKGQEIKAYDIVIEKLMTGRQDGKNMIIRISDEELLKQTGGIVQGMSGSPIIQDERIIGAVTHVFLNDPHRGYGVFIENMLLEADIIPTQEKTLGSSQGLFFYYS